ncbi:MAG: beta-ketoacyl-ACP synthase [Betaproteobacteria bacterium]
MTAIFLQAQSCVCALGDTPAAIRAGLFADAPSGVAPTDLHTPGRTLNLGCVSAELPSTAGLPERQRSRNNALLLAALAPLRARIQEAIDRFGPGRVAVVLGVSTAGLDEGLAAIHRFQGGQGWPAGYDYAVQEMGNAAECVAGLVGATGPAWVISTACSSGAKALASGARLLRSGTVDAVIAGGADALSGFTIAGFSALDAVSAERCNPLSANRAGINIGEGAALFVMGREAGPVRLAGWGESADAHHMSAPEPGGRGAAEAMQRALARAGVAAAAVDYVNLHGTATPQNDAMESLAVERILGRDVPVSSTKPLTGHALAAAGAIEAAFAWHTLVDNPTGRLPVHWWDGVVDAALPRLDPVGPGTTLGRPVRHVLSNSFAFGGSNASLLFAAP